MSDGKTIRRPCDFCLKVRPMRRGQKYCTYTCSNKARVTIVDPGHVAKMVARSVATSKRKYAERVLKRLEGETDPIKIFQRAYQDGYSAGYSSGRRRQKPLTVVLESGPQEG